MNYLESFKTFIKENKLLSLVAFGALVIIVALSLFNDGQKPTVGIPSEAVSESLGILPPAPRTPNLILAATPSAVVSFLDTTKLTIPSTARVYAFSQTATLSLDKVDKVAVKLGFKSRAQALPGNKYNWDEEQGFLHYDAALDGFVFGLNTPFSPISPLSKSETAKLLLDSLNLNFPDLVISDSNSAMVSEGTSTFLVPRIVNSVEVSSLPFDPALVSFDFNTQGQVTGGVYYYHQLQEGSQSYGVYSLKTVEEALAELTAGRGSLAEMGISGYEAADVTGLTSFSATAVTLLYHESREPARFLRPVYAFSGPVSLNYWRATTATYFVDAVK